MSNKTHTHTHTHTHAHAHTHTHTHTHTQEQDLYGEQARLQGFEFFGFGLEVLGGWGPEAQRFARELAEHADVYTDYTMQEALSIIIRSISAVVHTGNSRLIVDAFQKAAAAALD